MRQRLRGLLFNQHDAGVAIGFDDAEATRSAGLAIDGNGFDAPRQARIAWCELKSSVIGICAAGDVEMFFQGGHVIVQ